MQRTTHNLTQGTPPWHQHRASHFNASDASAMMGVSKYRSRASLLREKATGIAEEVDDAKQSLFDRGHAAEELIRPIIEARLSEDLYPVTMSCIVDGLPLSASLDGQNLLGDTLLECKLWNEKLATQVRAGELEPHYYWQLEQQLLVSGAERVIFATGDGGDRLETLEYVSVPGRAEALIASWKQFELDVAAYQPEIQTTAIATGRAPVSLPALSVVAKGMVEFSNVDEFRQNALAAIAAVNRDLQTDEDFATAELTVKAFKAGEEKLEATKAQVLGQMADVDAVMRTIDEVSEKLRQTRLSLDKLVTAEKEKRRAEIVERGRKAVVAHYGTVNSTMGEHSIPVPAGVAAELGQVIKGKKTVASLNEAVDSAVANFKIAASQRAEQVRANIHALEMEVGTYGTLFPDRVQLCATKTPEDLRNLVLARINAHKEAERVRQEKAAEAKKEEVPVQAAIVTPAPVQQSQPSTVSVLPNSTAKIKLGDLNERISPLTITAAGLTQLGFAPAAKEGNATLYREADFQAIVQAMSQLLNDALRKSAA